MVLPFFHFVRYSFCSFVFILLFLVFLFFFVICFTQSNDFFFFSMRMISGSKFISSKDGKNPKTKRDVHVKVGQTFVIAHGSCQFVTDLVNNCFHIANKIKGFINPIDLLNHAYLETKVPGSSTACIITLNEWVCKTS